MTTPSYIPLLLRPTMLLASICAATLSMTGCGNDANESQVSATSNSDAVETSETLTYSSFANRAVPATQYLVGTGKADITGAAAETGMFGYASGQVVEGINDRLYSHAFIIGDQDKTSGKRIVYVSADMGAMFTAVKLEVIKRLKRIMASSTMMTTSCLPRLILMSAMQATLINSYIRLRVQMIRSLDTVAKTLMPLSTVSLLLLNARITR